MCISVLSSLYCELWDWKYFLFAPWFHVSLKQQFPSLHTCFLGKQRFYSQPGAR